MIVAGEASGDLHASNIFLELKKQTPNIIGFGMGGARMREAGIDVRVDSSGIAVIGLDGIIRNYPAIHRALKQMKHLVCAENPDLLICVDYKEFNFKLAKRAKSCGVKVLFYVSPQIWAWRPGRVRKYGQAIDRMAVIFPFEVPYYEEYSIPVSYVGHPLAEKVYPKIPRTVALDRLKLDDKYPIIGLLPGSRDNEIKRLLPIMLGAGSRITQTQPSIQFLLIKATSVKDEQIHEFVRASKLSVRVVKQDAYDALQCCDVVLTTSGTATLEVALLGVPMIISYIVSPLTYVIGKILVNIPYIGLPNIIAGREIVKEFIQSDANAVNISAELNRILTDNAYANSMKKNLEQVREQVGEGGGTEKLARVAMDMLNNTSGTDA